MGEEELPERLFREGCGAAVSPPVFMICSKSLTLVEGNLSKMTTFPHRRWSAAASPHPCKNQEVKTP
jgi:hypothetical protein